MLKEFLDFLLEPYRVSSLLFIVLEIIAAATGILSVYFAKKKSILVFPIGLVSTTLYVYLLIQWNLFGDAIINSYYSVMGIYGWYFWNHLNKKEGKNVVENLSKKDFFQALGLFFVSSLLVLFIYNHFQLISSFSLSEHLQFIKKQIGTLQVVELRKIIPYVDALTTGVFFVAMALMARRKRAHWLFWIIGNSISIPLYFIKGYGLTGIQYFILLIFAFQGLQGWKKLKNA